MSFWLDLIESYGLLGLFVNIFLSYSILPTLTEVPIVASLGFFDPWTVFVVAVTAATLGSITNYLIGFYGVRRFMPENKKIKKAEKTINKWGPVGLVLLTWLPFIGDPIIIAAGTLRMNFWKFLFYSTVAKIWYLSVIIFFGGLIF